MDEKLIASLEEKQVVCEQPFRSDKPLIGPLVAKFRAAWNSIATKWYVLPLVQQQNEFNGLVVTHLKNLGRTLTRHMEEVNSRLSEMDDRLSRMEDQLEEVSNRLIDLDRDHTALTRNVAESSYHLIHQNRKLEALEAQLQGTDSREA